MVADSHSISARWRNHLSPLFNGHLVNDVRPTKILTAEPLVPESSDLEIKLAIEKLKSQNSPGIGQSPQEFIKAEGRDSLL
jgi:hypothetical protein